MVCSTSLGMGGWFLELNSGFGMMRLLFEVAAFSAVRLFSHLVSGAHHLRKCNNPSES
jgi:hypothetical protein